MKVVTEIMTHHKMTIVFFSWIHVFPKFLIWLTSYFQCTFSSPWENDCPYNKKQGLMSMPFPLGWCDQSTHSSHGPNVEKRPLYYPYWQICVPGFKRECKAVLELKLLPAGPLPSFLPHHVWQECQSNRQDKFLKKQVLIIQVSRKTGGVTTDTWALCFPSWLLLESF
jgi:hypothetical protein